MAILVCACASGQPAYADRYEASVHAQPVGGIAFVADPAADETVAAPVVGLGVRASYARSNLYQYDAQLTAATTTAATFPTGTFTVGGDPVPLAPFSVTTRLVRLDAGVTMRFGVRLVPTVRLALGVQERFRGAPVIQLADGDHVGADGRADEAATDLYGAAAVGLDYRLTRRLTVGASVGGSYAVPLGVTRGDDDLTFCVSNEEYEIVGKDGTLVRDGHGFPYAAFRCARSAPAATNVADHAP